LLLVLHHFDSTNPLSVHSWAVSTPDTRPVRQEREKASAEIIEVAPDVLRLQLPIALPGLAHINTYAIVGKNSVAIVDPGLPGPGSWNTLKKRLGAAGIPMKRIDKVVITHSHPDHFGNAGKLAKAADAQIVTHKAFRLSWRPGHVCTLDECDDDSHAHADVGQEPLGAHEGFFGATPPWGGEAYAPSIKRGLMYRMAKSASQSTLLGRMFPMAEPSVRLRHDQPVRLGDREWFSVHTPGHTPDHLCLIDPEGGAFLSGDHVLPTITPHISGMATTGDPLGDFFSSLQRVAKLDGVKHVLPAHGHPFTDLAKRCTDIIEHHEERLQRLAHGSQAEGWMPVDAYSKLLFRPERLGSMASSETYAHLEHFRRVGRAERRTTAKGLAEYLVHEGL
jgi:glyoxylase-like metal-dependent hydrolase (beta-lactamase superfamily II)